jgi:hypothetical protein
LEFIKKKAVFFINAVTSSAFWGLSCPKVTSLLTALAFLGLVLSEGDLPSDSFSLFRACLVRMRPKKKTAGISLLPTV